MGPLVRVHTLVHTDFAGLGSTSVQNEVLQRECGCFDDGDGGLLPEGTSGLAGGDGSSAVPAPSSGEKGVGGTDDRAFTALRSGGGRSRSPIEQQHARTWEEEVARGGNSGCGCAGAIQHQAWVCQA